MKTELLVVEDDRAVQELLRYTLEGAGFEVRLAKSAEEGLTLLGERAPDAMVVDWMLPGQSGLNLVRRVRADPYHRELPMLMLTAKSEESDLIAGLEHGADDYITKPFSPKALVARIRAVLRRRSPQAVGDPVEVAGIRLEPASLLALFNGKPLDLGPVEFKLLHFFAVSPGRVFNRDQILDSVWGGDRFVQDRTVDVYIRRIRAVLEASGAPDVIQTVRGVGYRCMVP